MRRRLPENCKYLFVPPVLGEIAKDSASPLAYYSARYAGFNFQAYASAIDDYDPFDLVFVDGRARPSCLLHAHKKVKVGGYLILDKTQIGRIIMREPAISLRDGKSTHFLRVHVRGDDLDAWESVSGQTLASELGTLQQLVASLPDDATIVELGVCQGRSGVAMLLACRDTKRVVYMIDDFNEDNLGYVVPDLAETEANVERLGLERWARIVVEDSTKAGLEWNGPEIDLLFHDASHRYTKVAADLLAWRPHMKSGGIVCLHDYTDKGEGQVGVSQAGDELLGKPTHVENRLGIWRLP